MDEAIAKAAALVEAHGYIRRFDGKAVVVKVGGSIMDEPSTLFNLIQDVCFMHAVGMRPILVHGGGKSITHAMQTAGLQAHFVQGRRYTDERTLAIAEQVLINQINRPIVDQIISLGPQAMGLHSLGSCAVFAHRLFMQVTDPPPPEHPPDPPVPPDAAATEHPPLGSQPPLPPADPARPPDLSRKIDLGLVGEIDWINADLLQALVEARYVPVIAPIARDASGGKLNVNADSVAGHVAAALRAEKLVLVSDTHGIRTSHDADTLASHLTKNQIVDLIDTGVITAGMLPKVAASFTALEAGVTKAHIIDGRLPHSLMLEVYTAAGVGTEIVL